jgi:hypothetical protein
MVVCAAIAGACSGGGGGSGTGGSSGAGMGGGGGTVPHLGPAGAPVACQAPIAITDGTEATVAVNLDMPGRTVSPELMGVHTSVYDSNMQLATTPDWLKAAGFKSLRYPGGSYSDLYHWELHTGTWTPAAGAGSNTIYIARGTDFGSFIGLLERTGTSAVITVNYGMNPQGNGPGVPQEAAAWVAYANGDPANTTAIGVDNTGYDWQTVGFWAGLRASAPLATDDGFNFLRINHPAPAGIKWWEVGNELYGNGYYYGGCGWEADMHVPYPPNMGTTCTGRQNNVMLSPAVYGMAVRDYAAAMKAVDPTVKVGTIVVGSANEYQTWNGAVLPNACPGADFAVVHWYGGNSLESLLTVAGTEIPGMFTRIRTALASPTFNCQADMPIMVTEWGPNLVAGVVIPMSTADAAPVGSQLPGIFAAESYAHFMEQGAAAVHWLELHNNSFLAGLDATNDPFTKANDTPRWGYHGARIAHFLASGGDTMVQATASGAFGAQLKAHASQHADGAVAVQLTNTSRTTAANVTVNVSGGGTALACVGARYAYTPVNGDQDGDLAYQPIFATSDGASVPVGVPPLSTVVVVFPRR